MWSLRCNKMRSLDLKKEKEEAWCFTETLKSLECSIVMRGIADC